MRAMGDVPRRRLCAVRRRQHGGTGRVIWAGGVFSNVLREAVGRCVWFLCVRCARRGVIPLPSLSPHAAARLVPRFFPRSSRTVHPSLRTASHEHANTRHCSRCSQASDRTQRVGLRLHFRSLCRHSRSCRCRRLHPHHREQHKSRPFRCTLRLDAPLADEERAAPLPLRTARALPSQTEAWVGVRNHEARNMMVHAMKTGQEVLCYNASLPNPHVAGLASVASGSDPDHTAGTLLRRASTPRPSGVSRRVTWST